MNKVVNSLKLKKYFFIFILIFLFPSTINAAEPILNAENAIVLDYDTKEIIYAKNIDAKAYPASITKLMSALLLSESKDKTDILTYGQFAASQPPYNLNSIENFSIKLSDTMNGDDVMKALLLYSANDAAGMIVDNTSSSLLEYQDKMNAKALQIGMNNTHFVTPNGLHQNDHYSTAYDIALLTKSSYEDQWIKETMSMKDATINNLTTKITSSILNRNSLLGSKGNVGGKTGFTDEAGRCLSSVYTRDGRTLIGVVLNTTKISDSNIVFDNMDQMIDYAYSLSPVTIYEANSKVDTVTLNYKLFKYFGPVKEINIPINIVNSLSYFENDVNNAEKILKVDIKTLDPWNITTDTNVGTVSLDLRNTSKVSKLYSTITTDDIINQNKNTYILVVILGLFGVLSLIFITVSLIHKKFKK